MVRTANQDNLFVDRELGLFIVADGMGGHNAGEVASAIAVREIPKLIREGFELYREVFDIVEQALCKANSVIFTASERIPVWRGMGTTVVLLLLVGDYAWVGHVGDSRAYLIRSNQIIRITEDHSLVAQWVVANRITPEEARFHPMRNIVSMALGTRDSIRPAISRHLFQEGDYILLCSDGLTEMLSDSEILKIVDTAHSPEHACQQLVDRANSEGGRDNITTVLVHCSRLDH
jgi:PPM family protein phosphatase